MYNTHIHAIKHEKWATCPIRQSANEHRNTFEFIKCSAFYHFDCKSIENRWMLFAWHYAILGDDKKNKRYTHKYINEPQTETNTKFYWLRVLLFDFIMPQQYKVINIKSIRFLVGRNNVSSFSILLWFGSENRQFWSQNSLSSCKFILENYNQINQFVFQ